MIIIARTDTNPYFNIAAEEYLLKNYNDDIFMLWINDPAIILGKHQNAIAEINIPYVRTNKIPVIRRISGGGTVFHDHGNLNFTFIKNGEKGKLVDFESFTKPIRRILNEMGVAARFEGKNDLRVHGKKISGNAEHVFKNRVLHHGTLLFDSQLAYLNEVIRVVPDMFQDRAVKSNRSIVTNIKDWLPESYNNMQIDDFRQHIVNEWNKDTRYPIEQLSTNDISEINNLVENKYNTWKWNFGYSPAYSFQFEHTHQGENYHFEAKIKNGLFSEVVAINNKKDTFSEQIQTRLQQVPHRYDDCIHALQGLVKTEQIAKMLNV